MKKNPINDDIIKSMMHLQKTNPDLLMDEVFNALLDNPEYAKEDSSPVESKLKAINFMINHFEKNEDYEKCGYLKSLKATITNV
jgi:hypothetical protein